MMPTPALRASPESGLVWPGGSAPCVFGQGGLAPADLKREGDGASPIGAWPLRRIFYRPDRLEAIASRLPAIAIAQDMGWCDDPASPAYNRLVRLPFPASHEKLWREDHVYDLLVELGYNDDPPIPGLGSAIFLHVMQPDARPTEGCIACKRDDLLALLACVGPGDRLAIAP